MNKSKFFEILSTFNKKQLQELGKLIQNNSDEHLIKLYSYLSKPIIEKNEIINIKREYIISNVFKNSIDEKKLQKILNEGVKLCEWIIIKNELDNDKYQYQLLLLNYFEKKEITKIF